MVGRYHDARHARMVGRLLGSPCPSRSRNFTSDRSRGKISGNRQKITLRREHGAPKDLSHSTPVSTLGQLMRRIHEGDPTAFPLFMDSLSGPVGRFRGWANSPSDADDLEQELWLTLWRTLRRKLPRSLESTYR